MTKVTAEMLERLEGVAAAYSSYGEFPNDLRALTGLCRRVIEPGEDARKAALELLREAAEVGQGDPEVAHGYGDDALCLLLRALGYDDIVDAWEGLPKWYA